MSSWPWIHSKLRSVSPFRRRKGKEENVEGRGEGVGTSRAPQLVWYGFESSSTLSPVLRNRSSIQARFERFGELEWGIVQHEGPASIGQNSSPVKSPNSTHEQVSIEGERRKEGRFLRLPLVNLSSLQSHRGRENYERSLQKRRRGIIAKGSKKRGGPRRPRREKEDEAGGSKVDRHHYG